MPSHQNQLRLFGLIQDLQKEATSLGLTRTASALEITAAVAMQEIADPPATAAGNSLAEADQNETND